MVIEEGCGVSWHWPRRPRRLPSRPWRRIAGRGDGRGGGRSGRGRCDGAHAPPSPGSGWSEELTRRATPDEAVNEVTSTTAEAVAKGAPTAAEALAQVASTVTEAVVKVASTTDGAVTKGLSTIACTADETVAEGASTADEAVAKGASTADAANEVVNALIKVFAASAVAARWWTQRSR